MIIETLKNHSTLYLKRRLQVVEIFKYIQHFLGIFVKIAGTFLEYCDIFWKIDAPNDALDWQSKSALKAQNGHMQF